MFCNPAQAIQLGNTAELQGCLGGKPPLKRLILVLLERTHGTGLPARIGLVYCIGGFIAVIDIRFLYLYFRSSYDLCGNCCDLVVYFLIFLLFMPTFVMFVVM